jgi:hypothetical protein
MIVSSICQAEYVICADGFLETGIYIKGDTYFRHRFLSKCHLPAKKTEAAAYAVSPPF